MNSFLHRVRRAVAPVLVLTLALGLQACDDDDDDPIVLPDDPNIAELVSDRDDLTTLVAALQQAGLVDELSGGGPFTVFAPTNAGFDDLGAGTVSALLESGNMDQLTNLLTYHVVPGEFTAEDLSTPQTLQTLGGSEIEIGSVGGLTFDGESIFAADQVASNGIVHVTFDVLTQGLDAVERASVTPDLSTLTAAVGAAGLTETLKSDGPFTIFAPVNSAFEGLDLERLLDPANQGVLAEILTYHVVPGEIRAADLTDGARVTTVEGTEVEIDLDTRPMVNGANIIATDIEVGNGVVHLIDDVLLESLDAVERTVATPGLATLGTAVEAAGLTATLQSDGPFTIFAPVDAAFEGLDTDALLDPANQDLLADLLTYHVIPGEVRAADLVDGASVATVEGGEVTIDLDGGPKVNGANIIATDVEVTNGVVHLIDDVLLESLDAVQRTTVTPGIQTLGAAVEAAGLTATLKGDGPFTIFAPIDDAFGELELDALLDPANQALLAKVLTNHVVPGRIAAADLVDGQTVASVEGSTLEIDLDGGPKVNGIDIIATDIPVENGIVHLIDATILDHVNVVERAIATPQTQTLVDAVVAGDLAGTLSGAGPFTVFAPTNEAFAAVPDDVLGRLLDPANIGILQKLLTYHVLPGEVREADLVDGASVATVEGSEVEIGLTGGATVNGANIIATDIETENGVIHLIDEVLIQNLDIVDQAVLYGFDSLVGAVETAGLTSTLRTDNGGAGFTVFAPTNDAFAAIAPVPTDPAVLSDILLYHVLPLTAESGGLSDGQVVATVQGQDITVRIDGSAISIEGATNTVNVIITDVPAANGVIHVIDAVLLP